MHRGPRDRGAAAVETALVLPILLLVVFGVIDFGRLLNAQIALTQAAREGARWVALSQNNPPVSTRVSQAAPNLSPVLTTVVAACPAAPAVTANAAVDASYTFSFITPLGAIAGLFGGGPSGTINLTSQAVMRCGG